MSKKYEGLKENLERFKGDLTDEKTRLLFSIAYKQGYDKAEEAISEMMSEKANELIQSEFNLEPSIEDDFFTLERTELRRLLELYAKGKLKEAEEQNKDYSTKLCESCAGNTWYDYHNGYYICHDCGETS